MRKLRDDRARVAEARAVRAQGPLSLYDVSIFGNGGQSVDDDLFLRYMQGGWMPCASGTAEEGKRFAQKVAQADKRIRHG